NVWEWCQDRYNSDYYAQSPRLDSQEPLSGSNRVVRGGSWHYYPAFCRAADRFSAAPTLRYRNSGFRVVRTP
ncbi:MAG: SUMF1/EgtB/PvdO family nonheme iron enzyme, partial [Gammaproteobacteria bacterium]|nr:SUMF1/EgtB/PvdO family nonheme iron enzyme [Gammaproteobacteria bacterium]